jgi:hypothetical protein
MIAHTSIERLSEQIYLLFTGGSMTTNSLNLREEIKYLVVQNLNRLMKIERLQEMNTSDYRLPDATIITPYTVTSITQDGDRSFFMLPTSPIAAPHGMGLYEVIVVDTVENIEYEMVPIPSSFLRTFFSLYPNWGNKYYAFQKSFGGSTGGWYSWDGGLKVILNSSDYAANHQVKIKLLTLDIFQSPGAQIAIPSDIEATLIETVLRLLTARGQHDNVLDDNPAR